jgi:sec-independent protein translocase protein TatA
MPSLGPGELVLILLIVVIVFGVGKLPEVGGALGKGIKEFRKASTEEETAKTQDSSEKTA